MKHSDTPYQLFFTKQAQKDAKKLNQVGLRSKAETILNILAHNPFENPPPYERLIGDLNGCCSRRINIQHRIVYEVLKDKKVVKVVRMWSHYE